MGVVRHADAGYDEAVAEAKTKGIDMPMLGSTQTTKN
jgi:urocanate hydratase